MNYPTATDVYTQLRKMFPQLPNDGVTKVVLVCDVHSEPKLYVTSVIFDSVELPKEEVTVFDILPRKANSNGIQRHAEQVDKGATQKTTH